MIRQNLPFEVLRKANMIRLPLFKNAKGHPAHSKADGSDWSLGEWMNAILGELGEAANLVKKIQRGDMMLNDAHDDLADEFADVVIYADITAFRLGIAPSHFETFDGLRAFNHSVKDDRSLGETMNAAFAGFGRAADMIDIYRPFSPELIASRSIGSQQGSIAPAFMFGLVCIDKAAMKIGVDLGNRVVAKFNTVSKRVKADVIINAGNEVVTEKNEPL